MLDKRKALTVGYELKFNKDNKYTIMEEIGRGASCIVYDASFLDSFNKNKRMVRIKECYPYSVEIERDDNGTLNSYTEAFEKEKEKFLNAYNENIELKVTPGLINSTQNAINVYSFNNTLYSVLDYVEGTDYRNNLDENIQSVFIRLKALAEIIGKYHKKGYLHLDIKPENMLIIPETKEHIILFDFDSLLLKENIKDNPILSFSYGYAAPELVCTNRSAICEATDIYSIGAIAFHKLFGRAPNALDGSYGWKFDFNELLKKDVRYQPEFYRKLEDFFHKTIAISVKKRYQNVNDELIPALEGLINLSSIEEVLLRDNFDCALANFIGREEMLKAIDDVFESGQKILFLYGFGGIGKTELAKKYADVNWKKGKYRHIIFLPFAGSIKETICSDELSIKTIGREESESIDQFYERKLKVLKEVSTPDDLVILDNLDIDFNSLDKNRLSEILKCGCRFLVTSRRENIGGLGYESLKVEKMESDDLLQIFKANNGYEYDENDIVQIKHIIDNILERHTMCVNLIAKYLQLSDDSPEELLKALSGKEGIANTRKLPILDKKDKDINDKSVSDHLIALFDLSHFSDIERELIRSLSLLGRIRIKKKLFLKVFFNHEGAENALNSLIARGWIEFDGKAGKISLHQIIMDLVYNYLKPTSENCATITQAMKGYICSEPENMTDRNVRNKMAELFLGRISGADIIIADFYLAYCIHIENRENLLNKVYEICHKEEGYHQCRMIIDAGIQRLKFALKNMADASHINDLANKELLGRSKGIVDFSKQIEQRFNKLADDPTACVQFYIQLYDAIEPLEYVYHNHGKDGLDLLYKRQLELLDKTTALLENSGMKSEEKISIYNKMLKFHEFDYRFMYRSKHFASIEKKDFYDRRIYEEENNEQKVYGSKYFPRVYMYAWEAMALCQFRSAIGYFNKALEETAIDPNLYINIYRGMAKAYEELDEIDSALDCLQTAMDKCEESTEISLVYKEIAGLYFKLNRLDLAKEYYCKVYSWPNGDLSYYEEEILTGLENSDFLEVADAEIVNYSYINPVDTFRGYWEQEKDKLNELIKLKRFDSVCECLDKLYIELLDFLSENPIIFDMMENEDYSEEFLEDFSGKISEIADYYEFAGNKYEAIRKRMVKVIIDIENDPYKGMIDNDKELSSYMIQILQKRDMKKRIVDIIIKLPCPRTWHHHK